MLKYIVFLSYLKNFLGLENEFESAIVNEPSVFESFKIYCTKRFTRSSLKNFATHCNCTGGSVYIHVHVLSDGLVQTLF